MKFKYLLKCKHCGSEMYDTYEPSKDLINITRCPECHHKLTGTEIEYLRQSLDYISSIERVTSFTVQEIRRSNP